MSQPRGKVTPHITPKKFSHPQENVPIILVLKEVDDPRKPSCNFRHSLVTIIFISLIGVLCGARDWEEIAQCAEGMAEWLGSYVNLSGGIPLCQNAEACFLLDPNRDTCMSSPKYSGVNRRVRRQNSCHRWQNLKRKSWICQGRSGASPASCVVC